MRKISKQQEETNKLRIEERKKSILNAAIVVTSQPGGWSKMTRILVAKEADCAESLISLHFGTMADFRRTVMRAAIKLNNLSVIGQGVACGDKTALKLPSDVRDTALKSLAG